MSSSHEQSELLTCKRCKTVVTIPRNLSPAIKRKVSELKVPNHTLEAAQYLKSAIRMDLGDAKIIAFHLAGDAGYCHRCRNELPEGEMIICPKCHCVNLNWENLSDVHHPTGSE